MALTVVAQTGDKHMFMQEEVLCSTHDVARYVNEPGRSDGARGGAVRAARRQAARVVRMRVGLASRVTQM